MDRRCFRTPAPASAPRRRRSTTEAPSRANTGSDLQRVLRWDAFKQVCKLQLATRLVKFIRIGPAGSSAGCEPHVPPGLPPPVDFDFSHPFRFRFSKPFLVLLDMQVVRVPWTLFIGGDRVPVRSMAWCKMDAKMVSPSDDFGGYCWIHVHKGMAYGERSRRLAGE
ncbi:uncharacterized protein LOC119326658 isoform X1 [Triticum dicoccoides]|uniref:uncharacterized protein LOC119326658 isoform X1 n=1 Tax=Triticum dicoccoides TaxID=85692 RepID=UPI001891124B|nr:uncharacterized protein LOC119326658 isoform X1 [Triticum dicoccoides]